MVLKVTLAQVVVCRFVTREAAIDTHAIHHREGIEGDAVAEVGTLCHPDHRFNTVFLPDAGGGTHGPYKVGGSLLPAAGITGSGSGHIQAVEFLGHGRERAGDPAAALISATQRADAHVVGSALGQASKQEGASRRRKRNVLLTAGLTVGHLITFGFVAGSEIEQRRRIRHLTYHQIGAVAPFGTHGRELDVGAIVRIRSRVIVPIMVYIHFIITAKIDGPWGVILIGIEETGSAITFVRAVLESDQQVVGAIILKGSLQRNGNPIVITAVIESELPAENLLQTRCHQFIVAIAIKTVLGGVGQ